MRPATRAPALRILSLLLILSQISLLPAQPSLSTRALSPAPAFIPDPREIPIPPIATSLAPQPAPGALPLRADLPDILLNASGQRITSAADWSARRAELRAQLEWYATGSIPPAPGNVRAHQLKSAALLDGIVHYRLVHLSFGPGEKLGFDIAIFTPVRSAATDGNSSASATAPLPTIIFPTFDPTPGAEKLPLLPRPPGQGKGVNALLPPDLYVPENPVPPAVQSTASPSSQPPSPSSFTATPPASSLNSPAPATASASSKPDLTDPAVVAASHRQLLARGYALVIYHYQDTGEDTTHRQPDGSWSFRTTRQFPAYPGHDWGLAAGWAWAISRVIDFLETEKSFDSTRLIATGHSRIGKAVLIAGAFDERIALSAPAGSGAGGTAASRFTGAGHGGKEGLDDLMRKYPNWFSPHLHAFRGQIEKLPFDQHAFIALTAPRAFISLEGTDDQNCVPHAVRQSLAGAAPVYSLLNASAGRAVAHYAPHRHAYDPADWAALLDFADQQLLGKIVTRTFNNFPPETTRAVL